MPHPPPRQKPPVLRQPSRLLRFALILLGLFVLIYAGTAATGFIRSQNENPEPRDADRIDRPATSRPTAPMTPSGATP